MVDHTHGPRHRASAIFRRSGNSTTRQSSFGRHSAAAKFSQPGRLRASGRFAPLVSRTAIYVAQGLILGASAYLASFSQLAARANQNTRLCALRACLAVSRAVRGWPTLGEQFLADRVRLLRQSPGSYGKGAIVGHNREFDHGGRLLTRCLATHSGSVAGDSALRFIRPSARLPINRY